MSSSYNAGSLFRVDGLVAVITGGGSGLGQITAHALAANGAKAVYILGRRESALLATKSTSPNPDVIKTVVCDVTSKDALKAAAERVRSEQGYCDVLFANSGIVSVNQGNLIAQVNKLDIKTLQTRLWEPSMEDFTQAYHVNVTAAFYTVVAFLDLLDEGNKRAVVPQKSQVIIISSIAGYARLPKVGFSYGTSKAAATQLAKELATLLAPHKIRVNCIAPGLYPSQLTEPDMKASERDLREEGSLENSFIPLARIGREEEFAGTVLYLASKAAGYVDGNVLVTDGGRLSISTATY